MTKKDLQPFVLRMPIDLWRFMKIRSAKTDQSMNDTIIEQLQLFKKKCKNKLTDNDIMIS